MAAEVEARRAALLIATGNYDDPKLTPLRAPDTDVDALANVLADPAIGAFDVDVLRDGSAREVMRGVELFFTNRGLNDLLLLYISGHGMLHSDGGLYFVATDTDTSALRSTGVASEFVVNSMSSCRARSIILVLDCCHSGAFGKGLVRKGSHDVGLRQRFEGTGEGRVTLSASSELEYAFAGGELQDLGSNVRGSVFTSYLVDGLRSGEADLDRDGRISVDELYVYVSEHVRQSGVTQTPGRAGSVTGDLVVALTARQPAISFDLRQSLKSNYEHVRLGAVKQIGVLRRDPELSAADAAELDTALATATTDSSTEVRRAARRVLGQLAGGDAAQSRHRKPETRKTPATKSKAQKPVVKATPKKPVVKPLGRSATDSQERRDALQVSNPLVPGAARKPSPDTREIAGTVCAVLSAISVIALFGMSFAGVEDGSPSPYVIVMLSFIGFGIAAAILRA